MNLLYYGFIFKWKIKGKKNSVTIFSHKFLLCCRENWASLTDYEILSNIIGFNKNETNFGMNSLLKITFKILNDTVKTKNNHCARNENILCYSLKFNSRNYDSSNIFVCIKNVLYKIVEAHLSKNPKCKYFGRIFS